ncbi:TD and POZ domain-containing protein 3 [Araneus ventricosus]|uniref:TD and POZ domain-containing protein 3 n=1 Tax=Araneus ventricosus TaxID=182803 RepID=A0A4Y2EGQ2_ARAVE|nr:TD and POZ domain-containing protein 3 [Araneus ventricosus]
MSSERKCFTFTWTVENISCCWQKKSEFLDSPVFMINALQGSKYRLTLSPRGDIHDNYIGFYLVSQGDGPHARIDCELAFLSKEGSVLTSLKQEDCVRCAGYGRFKDRKGVFAVDKSIYLPEDKLTARCRIWKSEGEMTKDVQCFARTRICIGRESFLWNIKNFSSLQKEDKCSYQIKSVLDNELLMTFDLSLENPYTDEDSINIQLVSENDKIKYFALHLIPLNCFGSANMSIRKEFLFYKPNRPKLLSLPFTKNDLTANDVLFFRCECTYSTGKIFEEIENVVYDCDSLQTSFSDNHFLDERNSLSVSKHILIENLKSLFYDSILSDIKLKTCTKTYLAHKNILSARSPVFKAMFSNKRKGNFNECVDIQDLDNDLVYRMLQYVYTAKIEDLQWGTACKLYRTADKYEILALRDECSAFLKSNLCQNKACEVLILANDHQDEDLKTSVQDFIINHNVVNSVEWKQLMKTHLKLAADTMHLQIQRKTLKFPESKFSTIDFAFRSGSKRNPSTYPGFESTDTKTASASPALNKSLSEEAFQPSFSRFLFESSNRRIPSESFGLNNGKGD